MSHVEPVATNGASDCNTALASALHFIQPLLAQMMLHVSAIKNLNKMLQFNQGNQCVFLCLVL